MGDPRKRFLGVTLGHERYEQINNCYRSTHQPRQRGSLRSREVPRVVRFITKVKVSERDESGRVTGATLTISAGALKDKVSLSYNWDGAPARLEFELEDANMLTKMDGAYILKDLGDETEVTYELSVGVSMPIPQMMVTKQEKTTIDQALAQLKEHCEG